MKKKCFVAKYFENFGIKQINDILLVLGMITLIIALCLYGNFQASAILVVCASVILCAAFAIGLVRHIMTAKSTSKHHPEFKHAIVNIVITGIGVAITLFAFIYAIVELSY